MQNMNFKSAIRLLTLLLVSSLVLSIGQIQANALYSAGTTCKPDFAINVSPTSLTVVKGGPVASIGVGFTSLCGLAGTINFGVRGITPAATITCDKKNVCTSDGPILHQCCYDLPLKANSSTGNHITVNATKNTLATTYQIRITGTNIQGGCCYGISHSENVTLTVNSCCVANFTIAANPTSIAASPGQAVNSAVTATGENGFSGTIYYSVSISPSTTPSESCNLQPAQPTLSSTMTSVTSTLSCSFATKGTYTVLVTGAPSSGVPSRSATVTITVK